MKEEKLKSIFYSFIKHRERDNIDGILGVCQGADFPDVGPVIARCNTGAVDDPLPRFRGGDNVLPHFLPQGPSSAFQILQTDQYALTAAQSNSVTAVGRQLSQIAEEYSSSSVERSDIGFETSCIIEAPEEHTFDVCVIRHNNCTNQVTKVTWKTCDKTAQSGIHYVGTTGELVFNEGETKKTIKIQILKFEDRAIDLRFRVELNDVNGIYNPKPLTITLKKTDNFYIDEKNVLNSLPQSVPLSIDSIKDALDESLTPRTFHIALSYLCSTEEAVHVQFALAFELGRQCLSKLREESIIRILSDVFRMDDIDF